MANPGHPVIVSYDDWDVQSLSKRIVFRFHYHSQKVIGPLTHRIHVEHIHLHLLDLCGKGRQIYHTWVLWVLKYQVQTFISWSQVAEFCENVKVKSYICQNGR